MLTLQQISKKPLVLQKHAPETHLFHYSLTTKCVNFLKTENTGRGFRNIVTLIYFQRNEHWTIYVHIYIYNLHAHLNHRKYRQGQANRGNILKSWQNKIGKLEPKNKTKTCDPFRADPGSQLKTSPQNISSYCHSWITPIAWVWNECNCWRGWSLEDVFSAQT